MNEFEVGFVLDAVMEVFGVPKDWLVGRAKSVRMSYARTIWTKYLYDLRDEGGNRYLTQVQVAKLVGRTHCTVIYRLRSFDAWHDVYPEFRDLAERVRTLIGALTVVTCETRWVGELARLAEESKRADGGEAHCEADALMCEILRKLGYGRVANAYDKVNKYYGC